MKDSYLLDRGNSSDRRPRIEQDIADNGLKILSKHKEHYEKIIAKTGVFRLKNGIGKLYYLDQNNKILAGCYYVAKNDFPVIGELIDEPLEMD